MNQTLLILSYVAKAAGFVAALNAIPGVAPSTGVIIFFIASLLKDTVNRIGDFLDNGKSDWRAVVAFSAILSFTLFAANACAPVTSTAPSQGAATVPTTASTLAQTIALDFKGATSNALAFANGLQKLNNGNALPPAAVTTILTLTHNSGDAATAAALNNLLGQFIAAQAMASTPTQSIANANLILAPANVNATVQAVAPAAASPPSTGCYEVHPVARDTAGALVYSF